MVEEFTTVVAAAKIHSGHHHLCTFHALFPSPTWRSVQIYERRWDSEKSSRKCWLSKIIAGVNWEAVRLQEITSLNRIFSDPD
jgi:hypothetical protein